MLRTLLSSFRHKTADFTSNSINHSRSLQPLVRLFSDELYKANFRNIGISAHIDSGKTTLTERILFYTGRIKTIHDVKGKDGIGAKMDSMDLEREKGITIKSAATYCQWGDSHINIIDTPGHVDFTVEVERSLRVLDGAILVLCGVSGVQSQSMTVDRQMKRYGVPRIVFINKLDRLGSHPWKAIQGLRKQLGVCSAAVQVPYGKEDSLQGVVDIVNMRCFIFEGSNGEEVKSCEIPAECVEIAESKRIELIEQLADVDEEIQELFLMNEPIDNQLLKLAIRRQTIKLAFAPVFMGSAFKNKGVQLLLDGVIDYLPSPCEVKNYALDIDQNEKQFEIQCNPVAPLLALAFKLEDGRFGQLTYTRIYQGTIRRGDIVYNVRNDKKFKIPRLVRMHSNEMEEVNEASAGDVIGIFGVECASMDSFTDGTIKCAMTSMFIPDPVISLSIKPKTSNTFATFSKALQKFSREDPTFQVSQDHETQETIISGMGELHLEIYIERMGREFGVECVVGPPKVNYRETIQQRATFNYLHKKQSGGQGQFGRVVGYVEPMTEEELNEKTTKSSQKKTFEFVNALIGMNIPPEYISSCQKGATDAIERGVIAGNPMHGVRVVLQDGQTHPVDSSDIAFRLAMAYGVKEGLRDAKPVVLEPIMSVEINAPAQFQGEIVAGLNRRLGVITSNDNSQDGMFVTITADVPLAQMFGYSTDLRSITQGKGEFTMEYRNHSPVLRDVQDRLEREHRAEIAAKFKK